MLHDLLKSFLLLRESSDPSILVAASGRAGTSVSSVANFPHQSPKVSLRWELCRLEALANAINLAGL